MSAVRKAQIVWQGNLVEGKGRVPGTDSGQFEDLAISWASRIQSPEGRTSPEELLAAAHASCFAMALAHGLAQAGMPPRQLEVSACVRFDQTPEGYRVTSSALSVMGDVENGDPNRFKAEAEKAKDQCPISKALQGNVDLSVTAELSQSQAA